MIQEEKEKTSIEFDVNKITKSSFYVRSMLGYSFQFYGVDYHNTYIGGDNQKDVLYLTFRKPLEDPEGFHKVLHTLSLDEYYIGFKESKDWFIIKMYVPMQYISDFYKFLDGKYSKLSEDYKENLLALVGEFDRTKILYNKTKLALYPNKEARKKLEEVLNVTLEKDAEIASIPNLDVERYNDSYFRKEDEGSKGNY